MRHIRRTKALIIGSALTTLALTAAVLSRSENKARIAIHPTTHHSITQPFGAGATIANDWQGARKLPLAFYLGNARSDLFTAPQPTSPATVSAPAPALIKSVKVEETADHYSAPDRFENYVYTGTVTIDGQIQALIENSRSRAGWYVKPGDNFQGAFVTSIDADYVTLTVDGQPHLLAKATNYIVVPMNAVAKDDKKGQQPDMRGGGTIHIRSADQRRNSAGRI